MNGDSVHPYQTGSHDAMVGTGACRSERCGHAVWHHETFPGKPGGKCGQCGCDWYTPQVILAEPRDDSEFREVWAATYRNPGRWSA